jgi:hypothetical protein
MRPRRVATTLAAVAATLTLALGSAADQPSAHRPAIGFTGTTPDAVRALASDAWAAFLDVFPARWGCLPDVTVRGAWHLRDRGDYDPDRHLVTVRIPGTAPNLRATLTHEFAHHLDFTCPAVARLRARFLAAQGLPRTTPWFRGRTWAGTPSEQFAEATVRVILGRRPGHEVVTVRPATVAAIRDWGAGR